jgi:hypothetical protein
MLPFNNYAQAEKVFSVLTALRLIPEPNPKSTPQDLNAYVRKVILTKGN